MNAPRRRIYISKHPVLVLILAVLFAVLLWNIWLWQGLEFAHQRVASLGASGHHTPTISPASSSASSSQTAAAVDRQTYFTEVGQTGDAFGGLNALLTAIAGALVAWAGFMQYLSLREAREEAKEERQARLRQEFESLFFRMLDLSRDLTHRIESEGTAGLTHDGFTAPRVETRSGAAALDSFAAKVTRAWKAGAQPEANMRALVQHFCQHVYNSNPSAFGPYFRLLFQTFKHVAESSLEAREKIQYANIARGQISEGAVLLLALNGLTPFGQRFIRYIEEFGLLEHMHPGYLKKYKEALLTGYRPRAFLGSKEREVLPFEVEPLHDLTHFV